MMKNSIKNKGRILVGFLLIGSLLMVGCGDNNKTENTTGLQDMTTKETSPSVEASDDVLVVTLPSSDETSAETTESTSDVSSATEKESGEKETTEKTSSFEDTSDDKKPKQGEGLKNGDLLTKALSEEQVDTETDLYEPGEERTGLRVVQAIYLDEDSGGTEGAYSAIRVYDKKKLLKEVAAKATNINFVTSIGSPDGSVYFLFIGSFNETAGGGEETANAGAGYSTNVFALKASDLVDGGDAEVVFLGNTNKLVGGTLNYLDYIQVQKDSDMYVYADFSIYYSDHGMSGEPVERTFIVYMDLEKENSLSALVEDPAKKLSAEEWIPEELQQENEYIYYPFTVVEPGVVEAVVYPEVRTEEERQSVKSSLGGQYYLQEEDEKADYSRFVISRDGKRCTAYSNDEDVVVDGEIVLFNMLPAFGVYEEGKKSPTLYIEAYPMEDDGTPYELRVLGDDSSIYEYVHPCGE